MKKLVTLLTLMAGASLTFGQVVVHQPGAVSFQNTESQKLGVKSHLVTNVGGALLVGTQFSAELYYVDPTTQSLTPVPATLSTFKANTTSAPGTWNGPAANVLFPDPTIGGVDYNNDGTGEAGDGTGTGPGYYPVTLVVKVWDATGGATYDNTTGAKGQSAPFNYTQRYSVPSATSDTQMIQQGPITLVPEPSAIALSVLGVAGLLLFRRRK